MEFSSMFFFFKKSSPGISRVVSLKRPIRLVSTVLWWTDHFTCICMYLWGEAYIMLTSWVHKLMIQRLATNNHKITSNWGKKKCHIKFQMPVVTPWSETQCGPVQRSAFGQQSWQQSANPHNCGQHQSRKTRDEVIKRQTSLHCSIWAHPEPVS